jgi:hypothetical protein
MRDHNKVFIPNAGGHDYSSAERFGEIVVMSEGIIDKFKVTSMLRLFTKILKDSEPSDWVMMTGPSVMCTIACSVFTSIHNRLNLLIWRYEKDNQHRYFQSKIRFYNKEKKDG